MSIIENGPKEQPDNIHITDAVPARAASQVRFTEIPHLPELTTILGNEIDWEMLDRLPITNYLFEKVGENQNLAAAGIHGALMEIHVYKLLQRTATLGQFPVSFFSDPIPNAGVTENFRFIKTPKGGYIFQRISGHGKPQEYVEIDGLIEINGTPVVLEVKSGTQGRSIGKSTREKRVQKIRDALDEVYPEKGFGYIVIAPPDILADYASTQQKFRERGGVIAHLGATSNIIDENVRRLATQRGILFVDTPKKPKLRPR